MDYDKIPLDVLRIVRKYKIELDIIKRNRKIKNEIEETFIIMTLETPSEIISSRLNMKKNENVSYHYKKHGLIDFEPGLYIHKIHKNKTSEVIYIYSKDSKIEVINLI